MPAGLAVAGVLGLGAICLPGVFLGSFILNVWVGYTIAPVFTVSELVNPIVTASASTLQAGIAGFVLRRAIGHPALLDQARDLLRFLLLTPALCLTSATLSVGGMWALGVIERPNVPLSWMTWWIGDTLGVLVVLPLMLALFGVPRTLWRRRAPYVAVPIVVFFVLFVAIFARISTWESDRSLIEFRVRSQHLADVVRASMEQQSAYVEQLGTSIQSRPVALTPRDFEALVGRLSQRFPITQAVGWAPRVAAADREGFELAHQQDRPGFGIRERDATGAMRPAGAREYFYPVSFLEPLAGKQDAIGLDIASNVQKQAAIEASVASGKPTVTDPLRVAQEPEDRTGTILLTYAIQEGPNGPGVVFAILQMRHFLERLLADRKEIMTARFIDVGDNYPLFDNFEPSKGASLFETGFTVGTRHYLLQTQPTVLYLATRRGWESWLVLSVGVFATGLLGGLLLLGSGYAHRIEQLVNERTFELQVANRRLSAEVAERERAESALQQARHMEAIGQLTGGVAHDFNNLLQIVLGNLEMLHRYVGDEPAKRLLSTAERGAERGARLVESLLAFARRQTLQPEIVDANHLIREFSDLIQRALGSSIELRLRLTQVPCWCRIDPAQFQSAILNLAVNARDAMPDGGHLTIESRRIEVAPPEISPSETPSDLAHLVISLRDTGCGMTPEVLDRAFEPFFTTKDAGHGSGLGLSQVYGFVKQSGGHVKLLSQIGGGTEIVIYLPLVQDESGRSAKIAAPEDEARPDRATILVVEDDPDVRQLVLDMLQELGYSVLSAANGEEAISILSGNQHIDLLFSDIVLPTGIRGDELGRRARLLRNGLKILLTTGYAAEQRDDLERNAIHILRKPFRHDELAEAIRLSLSE